MTIPQIIPLWMSEIPNRIASDEIEKEATIGPFTGITNIQKPELHFYKADSPVNKGAVIIIPGGGYEMLLMDNEGVAIAQWLNDYGINAFVLKHRLPNSKSIEDAHQVPLIDAKRAIRLIRNYAQSWNIDADKIVVMGFSAGGHLASCLNSLFDLGNSDSQDSIEKQSCRPDFSVLAYPVITLTKPFAYKGLIDQLLGQDPDKKLLEFYSTELNIPLDHPETFLVHANDDPYVSVQNSISYYQSLQERKIPVEMHLYPEGGHGFGLAQDQSHLSEWIIMCIDWILEKWKH